MQKLPIIAAVALLSLSSATTAFAQTNDTMPSDGTTHVAPMVGDTVTIGVLEIAATFTRATLPNQPVAGGFMTVTNAGTADDRLIGAASVAAGRMEVHEMAMDGDVMRMREIEDGLVIPAGETVTLKPGGFHIMFMDLAGPMVAGETVDVTLTFEQAGDVMVTMPIVMRPAGGMTHSAQEDKS